MILFVGGLIQSACQWFVVIMLIGMMAIRTRELLVDRDPKVKDLGWRGVGLMAIVFGVLTLILWGAGAFTRLFG